MKKLLLVLGLGFSASGAFGQIILAVEAPANIAGNVSPFTYADNWGADLSDPANAVRDTLVLYGADTTACTAATNAGALAGKIALLYRGTCEFGAKALKAQQAGAIGVIIINNVPDAPIPMGAGADGANVTIPVAMVSDAEGAILRASMANGPVRVFLGNKADYFANDMGVYQTDVLRAPLSVFSTTLVQAGSDMPIDLGTAVRNYGSAARTGVTVTAEVLRGATVLFTETSASFDVSEYNGGSDSVFVAFATFTPPTYTAGEHSIRYTINTVGDEYPADNVNVTTFLVNTDGLAVGKTDATGNPVSNAHYQPATFTNTFSECFHFRHPHASRIAVAGITFTATAATDQTLDGLQIVPTIYQLNEEFTNLDDMTDAQAQTPSLNVVATAENFFIEGNPTNTPIYAAFDVPAVLEDNQRYYVCVQSTNETVFLGFSTEVNYQVNLDHYNQPIHPIENNGTFAILGFESSPVPTHVMKTFPASVLSVAEKGVEAASYPNPAKDVVTVKVNANGNAKLIVTDLAGRTVSSENVSIADGKFKTNVSGMNSGTYVFNLTYDNGSKSQFKVVVTK
jgi:hypothetical protein